MRIIQEWLSITLDTNVQVKTWPNPTWPNCFNPIILFISADSTHLTQSQWYWRDNDTNDATLTWRWGLIRHCCLIWLRWRRRLIRCRLLQWWRWQSWRRWLVFNLSLFRQSIGGYDVMNKFCGKQMQVLRKFNIAEALIKWALNKRDKLFIRLCIEKFFVRKYMEVFVNTCS